MVLHSVIFQTLINTSKNSSVMSKEQETLKISTH